MIKKNTKVIIRDGKNEVVDDLMGGMPLSKGEVVNYTKDREVTKYEVEDKVIEMRDEGKDRIVDITYVLVKK